MSSRSLTIGYQAGEPVTRQDGRSLESLDCRVTLKVAAESGKKMAMVIGDETRRDRFEMRLCRYDWDRYWEASRAS